jgi:hypothetical protein
VVRRLSKAWQAVNDGGRMGVGNTCRIEPEVLRVFMAQRLFHSQHAASGFCHRIIDVLSRPGCRAEHRDAC